MFKKRFKIIIIYIILWLTSACQSSQITESSTTSISGCTDSLANNYNSNATMDDGSCVYTTSISGCTDSLANNYNSSATIDDGSCQYTGSGNHPINSLWLISNSDGTWGVGYNSEIEISGFQFNIEGATITNTYGGVASENAFTVSAGNSTVIGFSFGGSVLPVGQNLLTILSLDGIPEGISNITISDSSGSEVTFTFDSTFFSNNIISTGNSHLLIFLPTITSLDIGDEVGIFDTHAILNYNDCTNQLGELLVGAGIWDGTQLDLVSVGSIDMCDLGGVQLSGYKDNNPIVIKIWDANEKKLKIASPQFSTGSGFFSDALTVVSELDF